MSKVVKVTQDAEEPTRFEMTVERGGKSREKWMYEREETSNGLVSYVMYNREDTK